MTVLGKVAVPKPLNFPSQKLENHGLDPNVEIVPKGTLSWGNRSFSSASNPWGCATVSSNADGSSGSPSHPSGFPSSGGSGTRPSTAGSDKLHDPTANALGPNSRPSSASGSLTSNQSSLTLLRPRSAETRPGSSQLSRFAESSSDSSVAWGLCGPAEKLGGASSKNNGFSLSSGDFPTLGSGKENPGKIPELQDVSSRGRPSSSGKLAPAEERNATSQADVKRGTENSWKTDDREGIQPGPEKWLGDPQQYLNANIPPPHFDAWRGPPIGAPAGGWYHGPPGGPPYGTPVAPGVFPMESFSYYRPHIPPAALANSQPVPPMGAGPRGHHPKNGDLYRPQMPDAYIRPGMPIRPGFHPGCVPYEGYYGPPIGFCNSNERDIPFMGMPAGPPVYNSYPASNAMNPSNIHSISGGHDVAGHAKASEQVEHVDENQVPHKVLLKQHNEWEGKEEEENWYPPVPADASCPVRSIQPQTSLRKNEWGADNRRDEEMCSGRITAGEKSLVHTFHNRVVPSLDSVSWVKEPENEASLPEMLHQEAIIEDSILMQKIGSLNVKAGGSDGPHDVESTCGGEEQKSRLQEGTVKVYSLTDEAGASVICSERTHALGCVMPSPYYVGVSTSDKTLLQAAASGTVVSRRVYHGMQGKVDCSSNGRQNNEDAYEWRKKPPLAESSGAVGVANMELASSFHAQEHHASVETSENSHMSSERKDEAEFCTILDPVDSQAQRAKMRERAKQRVVQLQKEEEERIREQKAKALAKLEELNRRTQEKPPPTGAAKQEQELEGIQTVGEPVLGIKKFEAPNANMVSNPDVVAQDSLSIVSEVGDSVLDMPKNAQEETLIPQGQSLWSGLDVQNATFSDFKTAPHVNDGGASRQKRMVYKQKKNIPSEKSSTEKLNPTCTTEAAKNVVNVAANDPAVTEAVANEVGSSCVPCLHSNVNMVVKSSVNQRRKHNRSGRNKHKLDDTSPITALSSLEPKETHPAKASAENANPEASQSVLDPTLVQLAADAKVESQPSEQHSSLPCEEVHGRANNLLKSQHFRRTPRGQQANRLASGDAVVWARVQSQNKAGAADETSQKTVPDAATPTAKGDNVMPNNLKSKRAEMERYVPKPVAKGLAQQGSQQPISSFSLAISEETAGRAEPAFQSTESSLPPSSVVGDAGSSMGTKIDNKQNKQAKSHGAWRQRGSTESSHVQDSSRGTSNTSEPNWSIQRSADQDRSLKPGENTIKAQTKCSDEWNMDDCWNTYDNCVAAAPAISTVKDQGITGKGKRHPYKSYPSMENTSNLDDKSLSSGETYSCHIQSAALEMGQTDPNIALKENRGSGEQTVSHWQPKSLAFSGSNSRGSKSSGGLNLAAEVHMCAKRDSPQRVVDLPRQHDKGINEVSSQPHPGQTVSENKHAAEAGHAGHHENRREKKVALSRGRPYATNKGPVGTDEQPRASSSDGRRERSGVRKNRNQDNRSGRVHDSHGDWSSSGLDSRQHSFSMNPERHRHNSNYEYQPVGLHNNTRSDNFEGTMDGCRDDTKYREKGQGHSKRGGGNFYGRRSGNVRVDAGYD